MNNNVELLIRLIIPALFLLAWALNQVLNKEAPPAPQRGPIPDPFRNVRPPGQRPPGTLLERLERNAPPQRPTPTLRPGQEIVIVESESRPSRPQQKPPQQQQQSAQRGERRNRQPRRPSPSAGPLTPARGQAEARDRPRASSTANLTPGLTDAPVGAPGGMSSTASPVQDLEPRDLAPNPALDILRAAIASPATIRQAILINEILQPPVVLRGRRQLTGRR
jgi:hypothetical protein